MTNKKQTTTKTVEPMVTKTVETPTAKKTNTHGIGNLNRGFKKNPKASTVYRLAKETKDRKGRVKFPVVYMLKAEDVIFDESKSINRKIRYIPGEPSIFEDEQKKDAKVKSPITFNNGFLMVDYTNPTLKRFLDMCNANKSNPNRMGNTAPTFMLMDYEKKAQEKLEKSVKSMDALRTVFDMELDQLIAYANILGINTKKSTDEIRYDMKVIAEKDPEKFINGLNDPKMEIKQIVMRGKEMGILDWSANKIEWVRGSERSTFTHVPLGIKPLDHLADMCVTDSGSGILDQIKAQLSSMN